MQNQLYSHSIYETKRIGMTLTTDIQSAVKSDRAVFGYKRTIKNIKTGDAKLIVMANNIPDNMRKEIEHNAKIAGIEMEVFSGSSKELGVTCGKPFPVSAMAIRG